MLNDNASAIALAVHPSLLRAATATALECVNARLKSADLGGKRIEALNHRIALPLRHRRYAVTPPAGSSRLVAAISLGRR